MGESSLLTRAKLAQADDARKSVDDNVNPRHYASLGNYSAIHVIEKWELDYCLGNTVKYIQRAGKKDNNSELQDLLKAQWYLARRIHQLDPSRPDPAA